MKAIDAINTSECAMADHPGGRQVAGLGCQNRLGFTVAIPFVEMVIEMCKDDLHTALQDLGIDDEQWLPREPEGERA